MGQLFAGRYELLEEIAEGGMGSVWTVRDHKVGAVRAAKLLRHRDSGSVVRFIREQSMRIDHTHVVAPDGWAGEDDLVLFTMPLVRGGSVATLIGDHGPLPIGWVGELLDQTLLALDAVHGAGIVHRDVTPANLLLEPTGSGHPHLRLADFGVAVPLDQPRLTRASQVFATPGYTADEQLRGADPHPRQDLFSVGVVGLEMLSAVRPPEAREAARRRVETEPHVGPLVALLERASDPDPERRPTDATELRRALAGLGLPEPETDDGPVVFTHLTEDGRFPSDDAAPAAETAAPAPLPPLPTPPPPPPTARPPRQSRAGLVLLVIAAVCAVTAVALLVV